MDDHSYLAELVREKRAKANLTQLQLGAKSGASGSFITNLERGCCYSLLQRLNAVAIVLHIPPIKLIEAAWLDANGTPLRTKGITIAEPKGE